MSGWVLPFLCYLAAGDEDDTPAYAAYQAVLQAHAAYLDRVLACRGCDRPLTRKPGRGRDPRWCPACRAHFRRRAAA